METLCEFAYQDRAFAIRTMDEAWPIAAMPDLGGGPGPASTAAILGPITLSAETIAAADTLTLSAQVGGPDITFVYLELLLRDPQRAQYYGPIYRESIAAPRTQRIGGIEVPDWSEPTAAQVSIEPFLRLLTDGRRWALGFLKPRAPKSPSVEMRYTLTALYQPAWKRGQYRAQVSFDQAGEAKGLLVFHELAGGAAPQSVNPRRGDRFTPLLRLYRPAAEAGLVTEKALVQSNRLKWHDRIRWEANPLIPGAYLAGLVAETLDGQLHRRYATLVVASAR